MKRSSFLLMLAIAGCEPSQINLPEREAPAASPRLAEKFDPATTVQFCGRIDFAWPGESPKHWIFLLSDIPPIMRPLGNNKFEQIPNPNLPHYDEHGLVGAVVMLRGIDPARSKPWDRGPVEVELTDRGIVVHQDGVAGRVGFVHRGDRVIFRMTGAGTLGVRGRGADFFSHVLTKAAPQVERRMDTSGRVELTSPTGQFWASADLFVVDTPYITSTGQFGKYNFDKVPPGDCDFYVYLPNWNIDGQEIDPETSLLVRYRYAPPFEYSEKITLDAGSSDGRDLTLNAGPLVIP